MTAPTSAWDAHRAGLGFSDREDPPVICAAGLIDPDVLALRGALRQILAEIRRPVPAGTNPIVVRAARLDAVAAIAINALAVSDTEEQRHDD